MLQEPIFSWKTKVWLTSITSDQYKIQAYPMQNCLIKLMIFSISVIQQM